ncbi:hypothetical protein ACFE04_012611 [Oxalis oulophora]
MGSCEDSMPFDDDNSASEEHSCLVSDMDKVSCLDDGENRVDSNVDNYVDASESICDRVLAGDVTTDCCIDGSVVENVGRVSSDEARLEIDASCLEESTNNELETVEEQFIECKTGVDDLTAETDRFSPKRLVNDAQEGIPDSLIASMAEDETDQSCFAKEGPSGEERSVNLLECSDMPTTVLQQEFVQEEEQMDKAEIRGLPEEELVDEKTFITCLNAMTNFQPSSSIVYETPSEGKPTNDSPLYYLQEDNHNSLLSSADVAEEQTDVLVEGCKDDQEHILPPQNCELTSESVLAHEFPGNCIQQKGLEDDNSGKVTLAKTVLTATEEQIIFSANSDGLNTMRLELASESIPVACPMGYIDGQEEDKNIDLPMNVTGHSSEHKIELKEEKMDILGREDSDQKNEQAELNSSATLVHDLLCVSDMNADHKSESELLGVMKCVTESVIITSPSHYLLQSVSNSYMVDKPISFSQEEEQRDDDSGVPSEVFTGAMEEKTELTKVSCSTEVFPSENVIGAIVSSSSRRKSSRAGKSKKKPATKKPARSSKSKVSGSCQNIEITLNAAIRRKRSCIPRQARSSNWGSSSNDATFSEHYDNLKIGQSQTEGLGGRGSRKRNKRATNGNLQGSIKKCQTSNSCLRLRVKLGNNIILDNLNATHTDFETRLKFRELGSNVVDKQGKEEPEMDLQVCNDDTKALLPDVHVENKDSESSVITDKVVDDCLVLSSITKVEALDKIMESRYIDPGTSPDSEVINLVPDAQVGKPDSASKSKSKTKSSKKHGGRQKMDTCSDYSQVILSSTCIDASSNSASGTGLSEQHNSKYLLPSLLGSKSKGKGKPKALKSGKSKKIDSSKDKGDQKKLQNKSKDKLDIVCSQEGYTMDGSIETGNQLSIDDENGAPMDMGVGGVMDQVSPPDSAWVSCDDCHKWRRIPVDLANSLGEDCRWVCKDNMDKAYGRCSIPQEKSNSDINAELGISDAEEDTYDGQLNLNRSKRELDSRRATVPQKAVFKRIDTNEFLHRKRKTQTIDEVMVCHCKALPNGQLGCGDECLNRMLNIECVPGTCPCGDLCSNQSFQKRNYAKLNWSRCGKKGYGLKVLEDISEGQFLIEYVGEVLDMLAYEKRQKEYALSGHKHFYFMTLNGSEVIDACAKGNVGRFINHSCDPNCRTEKWMVNGEICVGLFAVRNIRKDEELTFDYNYVRVFGAAAKKCFCGASCCRGYIGGDPDNTEEIVFGDSDDEFPEPIMLEEGETYVPKQVKSRASYISTEIKTPQATLEDQENKTDQFSETVEKLEIATEVNIISLDQSASAISELQSSVGIEISNSVGPLEVSTTVEESMTLDKSKYEKSSVDLKLEVKEESMVTNDKSSSDGKRLFTKSRFLLKTSSPSSSVKKGKVSSTLSSGSKVKIIAYKPDLMSVKPKKIVAASGNGRFEAVQEKLNELLNVDGGVSKKKDAPKGYLKLLLLTAASGDSGNGETIQSNRDLSMILDALLKTKSRLVLTDLINKNGLQMLHNMMKQIRRNFKKIPILRKLLKVLEYLAVREILTLDRIIGGPPCHGRESFRESILSLCEHDDKQVHQIARNFRDRFIPRSFRRFSYMDRNNDGNKGEFHRNSTSPNHRRDLGINEQGMKTSEPNDRVISGDNTVGCSTPTTSCSTDGIKIRKRKTRWDQDAPPRKEQKQDQWQSAASRSDTVQNHEDAPPGFSTPIKITTATDVKWKSNFTCPDMVIIGYPQQKFNNRLPVSYGIPLPIVHQFGSLHAGMADSWVVAPSMPFYPFPPLPAYPREPCVQEDSFVPETLDEGMSNTSEAANLLNTDFPGENTEQPSDQAGVSSSHDLSTRYFRQQKWNRSKVRSNPWTRERKFSRHMEDYSKPGMGEGNDMDEDGSYCYEDMDYKMENTGRW